jgi:hypothetical protein
VKVRAEVTNLNTDVRIGSGALEKRFDDLAAELRAEIRAVRAPRDTAVPEVIAAARQPVNELLLLADYDFVQFNEWRPWARSGIPGIIMAIDQGDYFISKLAERVARGSMERTLVVLPEYVMPITAISADEATNGLTALRKIRETISPMPLTVIYAPQSVNIPHLDREARELGALGAAGSLTGIDNLLQPRGLTLVPPTPAS